MEQMYVRTTIRLPKVAHQKLLKQAYTQKKSLNELMLEKLGGENKKIGRWERFQENEKDLDVIRKKYAKVFSQIDPTKAVRQLRDGRAKEIWEKSH